MSGYLSLPSPLTADDTDNQPNIELSRVSSSNSSLSINPTITQDGIFFSFPFLVQKSKDHY